MANLLKVFEQPIKVEAFDEDWNSVGVFDSLSRAANKLFIRETSRICEYLNGKKGSTFKGKKRGITSYKTGKRYHFKKIQ